MPTDHNIRQLIINKLTDEEYDQAVKNADELYLTPYSGEGGGTDLPDQTGQSGKFLTTNGSTLSWANVPSGTVTSVRVQATSPVQSSTSTAQSTTLNTTISLANGYGDTKNPYASKTKNYVLAAPVSANGTPSFRALDKADIPIDNIIDDSTITKNSNDQIQTIGVKDVRTDNTIKTWTGTKSQYDNLLPSEWTVATQNSNLATLQEGDWSNLAYGTNKFIAVSTSGYVSTSMDGLNWTTPVLNSNIPGHSYALTYDGTKFLIIGGGYVSTSTDGLAWTTPVYVSNLDGRESVISVVYDGSKYVAINENDEYSISTNGTDWSSFAAPSTYIRGYANNLVYAPNQSLAKFSTLCAVGTGYISYSSNGTDWANTYNDIFSGTNWNGFIYDGNKFIALGDGGYITESENVLDWSEPVQNNNLTNLSWAKLCYGGNRLVALDGRGYVSTKLNTSGDVDSNTLYNVINNGLYLGTTPIANIGEDNSLPDQTGQSGKFLTTDGSTASWANVPAGTVTSVRVQAGTGLSSSQSTAQSSTLNTTISVASGYKLPTTTEWGNKQDKLTTQTAYTSKGTATKVPQITTNTLGQVTGITEVTITQPTVNNSTITIQKNGTNVDSFTTNAASGKNINITLSKGDVGLGNVDNTSDLNKPISTATQTALNAKQDVLPTQSGNDGKYLTTNGTTVSWATVQAGPKFLTFQNITASTWVSDNTYSEYSYKCVLTCTGVTSSDYAQVIFNPAQSVSGNYANVCLTDTDTVTIYSKVNTAISIPTITVIGSN